jgi:hypothetical protein
MKKQITTSQAIRAELKTIEELKGIKFSVMTDCYEYSNRITDLPQTRFTFTSRKVTDEKIKDIESTLMEEWGFDEFTDLECKRRTGRWKNDLIWESYRDKWL